MKYKDSHIKEIRSKVAALIKESKDITPLFALACYTMLRFELADKTPEAEHEGEEESFLNILSNIYDMVDETYNGFLDEQGKVVVSDFYFDVIHPIEDWVNENISFKDDSFVIILHTIIANAYRAKLEGLQSKDIALWVESEEDMGYDVFEPYESYAVIRELAGITISDPICFRADLGIDKEDGYEMMADALNDAKQILTSAIELIDDKEKYLMSFYEKNEKTCNMLYITSGVVLGMMPKHFDIANIVKDKDKYQEFVGKAMELFLGEEAKQEIINTGHPALCKIIFGLSLKVNILSMNESGKGLMGLSQGLLFDEVINMKTNLT